MSFLYDFMYTYVLSQGAAIHFHPNHLLDLLLPCWFRTDSLYLSSMMIIIIYINCSGVLNGFIYWITLYNFFFSLLFLWFNASINISTFAFSLSLLSSSSSLPFFSSFFLYVPSTFINLFSPFYTLHVISLFIQPPSVLYTFPYNWVCIPLAQRFTHLPQVEDPGSKPTKAKDNFNISFHMCFISL